MPEKPFLIFASFYGMTSVILGAFGAHGLKKKVSEEVLAVFETAAKYQIYHALALLTVAWLVSRFPDSLAPKAGWAMILGTFIFSGSLYTYVFSGAKFWGAITPIGGLLLIIGWALLLVTVIKL